MNMLRVDYFHPKTTPDFQIKKTVKLTVAIPGISLTHKLIKAYINLWFDLFYVVI